MGDAAVFLLSKSLNALLASLLCTALCAAVLLFIRGRLSSFFFGFYKGTVEKLKTPDSDIFNNFSLPGTGAQGWSGGMV